MDNSGPCNTSEILQALNGTLQTRVAKFGYYVNQRTMADLVRIVFLFNLISVLFSTDARSIQIRFIGIKNIGLFRRLRVRCDLNFNIGI